ncbi:ferredoxin [Streptomyces sp. NPDC001532]|uniref:ferredoxin n=1 Tax=Streptomyces sp. NPDC001532 TaxID=3154520 RepID=UPI003322A95B
MEIAVDEDRCVAAGHCVVAAPEIFDQREDDGVVVLLDARPPAVAHETVREAALLCPAAVIRLRQAPA